MKKGILCFLVFSFYFLPSWAQRPCRDTVVHFSDSVCEGVTYHWGGRDLTYSGVFYDTLTRASGSCDSISILHLIVLPDIDLEIFRVPICKGTTGYQLIASFRGFHQQWQSDPPDPTFSFYQIPNRAFVNPSEPTTYTVFADYAATPTCPDTASITINPIQPVKAALTVTPAFLNYDHAALFLHDGSTGNRTAPYGGWNGRNWFVNGERLTDIWQPDITLDLNVPYPDTVRILMQAYSPSCVDTVSAIVPFNKDLIAIPNVFTPEADENNRFLPLIQNVAYYHIYIYNRYGRLVFDTTDPTLPWDGTHDGIPQPQGAYNYRIVYSHIYSPSERHTRSGTVTLLR